MLKLRILLGVKMNKIYFILALLVFCVVNSAVATENCITGYACKINMDKTTQENNKLINNKPISEKINDIFKKETKDLKIKIDNSENINSESKNNNQNSSQK